MENYYVYIYRCPDTFLPFYIGKGKGSRYKVHLNMYKNGLKKNKIKKIFSNNKTPIIDFYIVDVNEDTAILVEKALIQLYGRRDIGTGILTNMTDGGEGTSHIIVKRSDETKKKLSEIRSNKQWIYNQNTDEEKTLEKGQRLPDGFCFGRRPNMISGENNPMFGKPRTDEWKENFKQWHKENKRTGEDHPSYGSKRTIEEKNKISEKAKESYLNGRTVNCAKEITIDGVTYTSLKKAHMSTGISLKKLRILHSSSE